MNPGPVVAKLGKDESIEVLGEAMDGDSVRVLKFTMETMDMITMIPTEPILRLIPKDQNFKIFPITNPKIESIITLTIKSNSNQTTVPVINTAISIDQ